VITLCSETLFLSRLGSVNTEAERRRRESRETNIQWRLGIQRRSFREHCEILRL